MRFHKGTLDLVLIEAKNQSKSSSIDAEKSLIDKLKRLGLENMIAMVVRKQKYASICLSE